MSDERRVHAMNAIEIFFKGKDNQRLVDIFAEQFHASLTPCPELRTHVIHDWDAALAHLASHPPIERGRINDDSQRWAFGIGGANQLSEESVDFREMAEDFRDADDCQILGVDDDLAP